MRSLVFLVPISLFLGGSALAAFLWSVRNRQYDDLEGAAHRSRSTTRRITAAHSGLMNLQDRLALIRPRLYRP
jgi:cbb3-type cytochrome oxidase maturation protein